MTLAQQVAILRRELAAGGSRRARALPYAHRLQAAISARAHLLDRPPPRPRPLPRFLGAASQAQSGNELASGVHTIAPIANAILPGSGQVLDTVFSVLAPVLDTSLASVQCIPGNAHYPGCAIPGGSAEALIAAGATPQQAAAIVADVIANGPSGGGASDPLAVPVRRMF